MERTMSVEERIRRAEEIYERRKHGSSKQIAKVEINQKKDIKLLRKMIVQIVLCLCIYSIFYLIQNSELTFFTDIEDKIKSILSYDTNLPEIYENSKNKILEFVNWMQNNEKDEENNEEQNLQAQIENKQDDAIGGAVEEKQQTSEENVNELTQMEKDVISIKNTVTFIRPIEGIISSKYGQRDTATGSVPKNHTGIDIAANLGIKIKAATDGEVVLSSEEGDYGKHLKIQNGNVSIIYAHCNNLYVKQGDKVIQGQEIAEVGSTGNSTRTSFTF